MNFMTYCGYVEFLIVIIIIRLLSLRILIFFLCICFSLNFNCLVINEKIFLNYFFGDLEIIFRVWSLLFLSIVIFIRTRVIIFSFSYIRRLIVSNFIFLYIRFVFRILWLIIRGNFYWLILGWDGLGVVSFLLILFYINYERINNGLFTLFQNRLGDVFFVFFLIGCLNLSIGFSRVLKFGLIFLIFGACVKRAQFPFNSWLLAAISAPTPISSLVHSSTLVVAGVYILLQFRYCLRDILWLLKFIAVCRLLIRSFGLLNEFDMKKLIAYSTISHVSLIIYILRIKLFKVVYFHLNIHAIFKSLIFICFGFVILISYHGQDKRLISLRFLNPIIKIIYYFSCLCLIGLPFLSAFFSKDLIIEKIIRSVIEFLWIFLLIVFLRIRVYYSLKLRQLYFQGYSYRIIEKNWLGLFSVAMIIIVIIIYVNVFLRLILRLTLEFFFIKIFIYWFIIIWAIFSLRSNWNFKIVVFDKIKSFKEVWCFDFYVLDKFIYWAMFTIIKEFFSLSYFKIILLINWWVLRLIIFIF